MGYAGYAPGLRTADKLTPLQQALRALPLDKAQETLELIQKLTVNVVRNPSEEKFRRIKLTNPKIAAAISQVPFAVDALKEMGWVLTADEEALELPATVRLTHETEVIGLIEAKDHFKKAEEDEKRRQVRARKEKSQEVADLEKQMEVDRLEKAADGPVLNGSVAKQIGGGGPNIMRAGDLGIGKSSGG